MQPAIKILVLTTASLIFLSSNILAENPVKQEADTLIIECNCQLEYLVNPFILTVKAGDVVKFESSNGVFSILFRDANQFFEVEEQDLTISLDSESESAPSESELLLIQDGLLVGSEIEYIVVCLSSGKIIEAPPRIIIIPVEED